MLKNLTKSPLILLLLFGLLITQISVQASSVEDDLSNFETTGTCPPVGNTPLFTIVYGNVTLNGNPAPLGSLVKAYSPRDELVGCFVVTTAGNYGAMYIYGEDTSVEPSIPGMRHNEPITFAINDVSAVSAPTLLWTNDKDLHEINLTSEGISANFTATPFSGIAPLNVQFSDNSSGEITSWSWDFGDGGTSILENPVHTYTDPGTYTVSLTISGDGGESTEIKTDAIEVYGAVEANFTSDFTDGIAPLTVNFTDTSTGSYSSWLWDFGDGGTSTLANPSHEYTTPGVYSVTLSISGDGGIDDEIKTDYITIYTPVTANFTGSPTSGIAPLSVTFTDASTGDYSSWSWDFGDGNTSTLTNPSHEYTTPGIYTVSLIVSGDGGTDDEIKTVYITVYAPVVADFTGSPTSGIAPLSVTFTNTSTGDYDSYAWSFGDGGTSTLANPVHIYTDPGTFTVSLTVSGNGGESTETKTAIITVYGAVVANFTSDMTQGIAPLMVNFTDTSTGTISSRSWAFGDGGTSTEQNPSHQYTTPGIYTVSLIVSGDGGTDEEVKTDHITVHTPVVADFTFSPTTGTAPLIVTFTNTSSGDYDTLSWDFGDGSPLSNEINPIHTYNEPGLYPIILIASGPGGEDTAQAELIIEEENISYLIYLPLIIH